MAIYRLLQQSAFTPDDIDHLVSAYEHCLQVLKLDDPSDPACERVAKIIIEIGQTGVRDAVRLRELTLKRIKTP